MLPLGSADVNVRSGMPTAESRRSPFGQFAPILVVPAVSARPPNRTYYNMRREADVGGKASDFTR